MDRRTGTVASCAARIAVPIVTLGLSPMGMAQESNVEANATLIAPLSIVASEGLSFGTLAVSMGTSCIYEVLPDGTTNKSGDQRCAFLSGAPTAATFELDCGPGAMVRMEVIHSNLAPTGAEFAALARPMAVDSAPAGAAMQLLPCDSDGRSVIHAGGRLTTRPTAGIGFSGRVGTIRLEVIYD
ncbi:MAG: DUF4402 domain-containing protein [Sphingobium sp.]